MYSKLVLLILFVAIVALGVLLYKQPAIPDGFIDGGFCARNMGGDVSNCNRFYPRLVYANALKNMNESQQVAEIKRYIDTHLKLLELEPNTYANLGPDQQFRAIQTELGMVTKDTRESSRIQGQRNIVCPSSANFDANGKIHVEPSGRIFDSLTDYNAYLTDFYANNPTCKAIPPVAPYTGPQPGVLGGLGTGTPSSLQIAGERNDRTVVNKALEDLFEKAGAQTVAGKPGEIPVRVFQFPTPGEQTYAKTPINSLDDYEFNRVFELENRPRMAELSKNVKNNLLNAMQLDWPILPYSSDTKTKLEEQFVDARMQDGFREPKSGVFFRNMEGVEVAPPDENAQAVREAKILSAYQPTDITTHVVDDEYERVAKVVAQQYSTDPDWEPVVEKRGPHQYAVTELRPRRKKNSDGEDEVVWEDEAKTTVADAQQQGLLEGASVKPNSMSIQDNLADPFFAKTGVADHSNDRFWRYQDFNKWTSNLERQFAPTDPTNEWH